MSTPSKSALTAQELADRLKIPVPLAWKWGREQRIPGVFRVGRLMRFDEQALDHWIAGGGTHADAEGS